MNESKAKTKWCPLTRAVAIRNDGTEPEASFNLLEMQQPDDDIKPKHIGHCIASGCMMWRWNEPLFDGPDSYISEPGPEGYCGLAGSPLFKGD